jgi:hypothetical protein
MTYRFAATILATSVSFSALAACGSEEEPPPSPPEGTIGTDCDPAESVCIDDLVCSVRAEGGAVCTHPVGAVCDQSDEELVNGGCPEHAECVQREEMGDAMCLLVESAACEPSDDQCSNELTCAELVTGEHRCFGQVVLRGDVSDTTSGEGIGDAHVLAIDEEGVAITDVAVTDEAGDYELELPVVRWEDGSPMESQFTLRGSAQDYQAFPSGIRVALPINTEDAAAEGKRYVLENALTAIGLIPLEDGDRTTISGSVVALEGEEAGQIGGVLVVAASDDGAYSALTDHAGSFTIFNVPSGNYEIRAYAADIQISPATASVAADPVEDVVLSEIGEELATVSGNVQIVNAAGGEMTSVILVVEDTFDPNAARGEVPRGLRAPRSGLPDVTSDFTITGVPVGRYVALAAYENDGLVRDPDTNIAGTDFVTVEVIAGETTIALEESFKVTAALGTVGPGVDGPEAVTEKPTLVWVDDSSEDWYDVRVFDALGNEVWSSLMVSSVSGEENVSLAYEGPLDAGMYYQFRVSSWRAPGGMDPAPIATTEDLRGVFFLPAE